MSGFEAQTIFFAVVSAVGALWVAVEGRPRLWKIDDLVIRTRVERVHTSILLAAFALTGACTVVGVVKLDLMMTAIGALTFAVVVASHRKARRA